MDTKKKGDSKKKADAKRLAAWNKMLAKVFNVDTTKCPHCKSDMPILAAITTRNEVARYLKHLSIEHKVAARACRGIRRSLPRY